MHKIIGSNKAKITKCFLWPKYCKAQAPINHIRNRNSKDETFSMRESKPKTNKNQIIDRNNRDERNLKIEF